MTMIAAIHSASAGPILVGDCCVSWTSSSGDSAVRDEWQKVYALFPHFAMAYSSNNVDDVRVTLKALSQDTRVFDATAQGDLSTLLAALRASPCGHPNAERSILAFIVAPTGAHAVLALWDNAYPSDIHLVPPGTAEVLGSGAGIADIQSAASSVAVEPAVDAATCAAAFVAQYAQSYAADVTTFHGAGVGGLLQVAYVNEAGKLCYSEGEALESYDGDGMQYSVSMSYDETTGRWVQRRSDGLEVSLRNLLVDPLVGTLRDLTFDLK